MGNTKVGDLQDHAALAIALEQQVPGLDVTVDDLVAADANELETTQHF